MITSDLTAERIREYLQQGKRFDGRKLTEFRDIKVETGISKNAEGSARVRIGKTEVIAGVKMSTGAPYDDSPDAGNFMVTGELTPLSSPRFEAGPPKFPAIELSRVIDRGLRESGFLDFKKLCIKKGEKVWTVFVDIYTMNDDGNLLDTAALAAIIAMKTARFPEYDEETDKISYGKFTDKKLPLTDILPLQVTAHKIGDKIIFDPTREEEDVSETRLTIGSSRGSISSMQKGEKASLEIEEFNDILDSVEEVWNKVFKKVEEFVK